MQIALTCKTGDRWGSLGCCDDLLTTGKFAGLLSAQDVLKDSVHHSPVQYFGRMSNKQRLENVWDMLDHRVTRRYSITYATLCPIIWCQHASLYIFGSGQDLLGHVKTLCNRTVGVENNSTQQGWAKHIRATGVEMVPMSHSAAKITTHHLSLSFAYHIMYSGNVTEGNLSIGHISFDQGEHWLVMRKIHENYGKISSFS